MFIFIKFVIAICAALLILRVGLRMLAAFASPMPEPPPPGELRKVKLTYRCEMCGSEARMTIARQRDPEPPRHCMDEMTLLTVDE